MTSWATRLSLLALLCCSITLHNTQATFFQVGSPWTWKCEQSATSKSAECVRVEASSTDPGVSQAACKLTCYDGSLIWPKPTGKVDLSKTVIRFTAENVLFTQLAIPTDPAMELLTGAKAIFLDYVNTIQSNGLAGSSGTCSSSSAQSCESIPFTAQEQQLNIEVIAKENDAEITLTTDESYTLAITTSGSVTKAIITAETFFGARHALETLSQLIVWDDLNNNLLMIDTANIIDGPAFPHRGLSLDTSRSYFTVPQLKKVIDGLSYDKMNVLHWHITDSHSFPIVTTSEPLMAIYGAYSGRHVYRPEEVRDLVRYATERGVKIVPEFDAPGHVGNGWQWGPKYGMGDLVLCFDKQPWDEYCAEPPCGFLNPVNNNTYKVLSNIYRDYAGLFKTDVFHSGGDEVNVRCWNETQTVLNWMALQGLDRNKTSFMQLWSHFQNRSADLIDDAFGKSMLLHFWTSDLTNEGHAPFYLDKNRYIIQFWDNWNDTNVKMLFEQGYRLIMSNADAMYLDCGYGAWVGTGLNNWCSPYIGWQKIYENSPRKTLTSFNLNYNDAAKKQFLGGEAALWTEQVQGVALETKIWPRLSAVGERFWSDPISSWRSAENRFLAHRERIVERGIAADLHQPEWCRQNGGSCYLQ